MGGFDGGGDLAGTKIMPDMKHWRANRDRLEVDARAFVDSGHLQALGYPEPLLNFARAVVTILDKRPELARDDLTGPDGKPLTASQKRKLKREGRVLHEVEPVNTQLEEGDERYKVIPYDEYKEPPRAPYVRDGKRMPDDWEPITLVSQPTAAASSDQVVEDADPKQIESSG